MPPIPRTDLRRLELAVVELNAKIESMQENIEGIQKELRVQFTRISQLQADLDIVRAPATMNRDGAPYTGRDRRRQNR